MRDDYFTHLYGEAKDEVLGYLYELESNMPYKWLASALIHGLASEEMAESVTHVKDVTARGREIIKKYYNASERVQTAAIRLLEKHADSTDGVAEILHHRALGNYDEANECHKKWVDSISEYDNILKTCFDFHQHTVMIDVLINRSKNADLTQT